MLTAITTFVKRSCDWLCTFFKADTSPVHFFDHNLIYYHEQHTAMKTELQYVRVKIHLDMLPPRLQAQLEQLSTHVTLAYQYDKALSQLQHELYVSLQSPALSNAVAAVRQRLRLKLAADPILAKQYFYRDVMYTLSRYLKNFLIYDKSPFPVAHQYYKDLVPHHLYYAVTHYLSQSELNMQTIVAIEQCFSDYDVELIDAPNTISKPTQFDLVPTAPPGNDNRHKNNLWKFCLLGFTLLSGYRSNIAGAGFTGMSLLSVVGASVLQPRAETQPPWLDPMTLNTSLPSNYYLYWPFTYNETMPLLFYMSTSQRLQPSVQLVPRSLNEINIRRGLDRFGRSNAVQFDGIDDYLVSYPGDWFWGSSYTVSFWIYSSNLTNSPSFFGYRDFRPMRENTTSWFEIEATEGLNLNSSLAIQVNQTVFFLPEREAFTVPYYYTDSSLLNRWQFITKIFDGGRASKLYLNGNLVATSSKSYMQAEDEFPDYNAFVVGVNPKFLERNQSYVTPVVLTNIASYFNGTIDDILIYDRELTPQEIRQLYVYNPDPNASFMTPTPTPTTQSLSPPVTTNSPPTTVTTTDTATATTLTTGFITTINSSESSNINTSGATTSGTTTMNTASTTNTLSSSATTSFATTAGLITAVSITSPLPSNTFSTTGASSSSEAVSTVSSTSSSNTPGITSSTTRTLSNTPTDTPSTYIPVTPPADNNDPDIREPDQNNNNSLQALWILLIIPCIAAGGVSFYIIRKCRYFEIPYNIHQSSSHNINPGVENNTGRRFQFFTPKNWFHYEIKFGLHLPQETMQSDNSNHQLTELSSPQPV